MGWRRGYTIVELLVVIVIAGILAAGGYPQLMGYSQEARLEQHAYVVYNDICTARDIAMAAGTGTVTLNFLCDNSVAGNPIIQYEIRDRNDFGVNLLMDRKIGNVGGNTSRYYRLLASIPNVATTTRAMCIAFPANNNDLPQSPTSGPATRTLIFNSDGNLAYPITGSMAITLKFFNETNRLIDSTVGTWVIQIFNDPGNIASSNGKIYMRKAL